MAETVTAQDDDVVQWAYVCGAYPTPFKVIEGRLQKMGINIAGHCDDAKNFGVPKKSTLIIVISDQCGHNVRDKAREAADQLDLPYVAGPYKNWVHLETRLRSRNLTGKSRMELVAGGQDLIPEQDSRLPTKLGDGAAVVKLRALKEQQERARLAAEQAAKTGKPLEAANPPAEPLPPGHPDGHEHGCECQQCRPDLWKPREEPAMVKEPSSAVERGAAIKAALKKVFEKNKGRLKTYTNYEAADDAAALLGWSFSNSVVGRYRDDLGFDKPPAGFKRPRVKDAAGARPSSGPPVARSSSGTVNTPTVTAVSPPRPPLPADADQADKDFDVIQGMLDEWVVKYAVGKLYLSFDKGEWDVNWDQVKVVTKEKKYTRKKA